MAKAMIPNRLRSFRKRKGMILIISLLLMAMMSIIGAAALSRSRVDLRVTHNTRVSKNAFYIADAGVEISPKMIRATIEDTEVPAFSAVSVYDDTDFMNEIMDFSGADPSDSVMDPTPTFDFSTNLGTAKVMVDIDRKGIRQMSGGGAEYAAGAEGVGAGSSGSILIYYQFDSLGYFDLDGLAVAGDNARTRLDAYYRFVYGVAGGK